LAFSNERPKLVPITPLSKAERKVFDHTARENPHLKPGDIPMLELYAMAHCRTVAANKGGKGGKGGTGGKGGKGSAAAWEREARITMSLGTKLRVTQQATTESRKAARMRADVNPTERRPWDRD
jgi:hypothetical protein